MSSTAKPVPESKKQKKQPKIKVQEEKLEEITTEALAAAYDEIFEAEDDFEWLADYFYEGYNREDTLKRCLSRFKSLKIAAKISAVVNLRGPKVASGMVVEGINLSSIPKSSTGKKLLSLSSIGASYSDYVAHSLLVSDAPKRIKNHPLPACLQFPAAGSLSLSATYRPMHLDFCKQFSALIGGKFSEDIYKSMETNTYCNAKFKVSLKDYVL
jgi:hypothetical protein